MNAYWINDYAIIESNILSPNFKGFGTLDNFFNTVIATGYPFFSWNGKIYRVKDYQDGYEDTNITIENVEVRSLR
jgi:hypothetical protein